MKLNYITNMVRNLEKSAEFYEKLIGLYVDSQLQTPKGRIKFMVNDDDGIMIELIDFPNEEKVETKGIVISYHPEEDLEVIRDRTKSLGYEPSEIEEFGAKPKFFTVKDPDGITVEFS